jgi:hypothetical protein
MKTNAFVLFVLTVATFFQAQSQTTFVFPFDTSSKWEYDIMYNFDPGHPGHATLRLTKDTLMPNGQTYRAFSNGTRPLFFFRRDSSRIFQYNYRDSSEFIRYDFARKPGDTLSTTLKPTPFGYVILVYDRMSTVLNESRRMLSFQSHDGVVWDDIADTIGIVNFNSGATEVWYSLTGALVNGRAYGVLTGVSNVAAVIPMSPSLSQNYPNPFNPSTTISFSLPERNRVALLVYNLLGAQVATLFDNELGAGIHSVKWDAAKCASGVYFYTLKTSELSTTKCMLLLK